MQLKKLEIKIEIAIDKLRAARRAIGRACRKISFIIEMINALQMH